MIIVNRADQADFQGESLSDKQIEEIMEYDSVERMFSSGIFFLSSIMGLGSKLEGNLSDKFYKKTYRQQSENYSDPDDEYFVSLQNFNIMPKQIKRAIVESSKESDTPIYVNSGLYCIEEEMEKFASDYSAYNKCQMAYQFLDGIIAETASRISVKTAVRGEQKAEYEKRLDVTVKYWVDTVRNIASDISKRKERESKSYMDSFIMNSLQYAETVNNLNERDKAYSDEQKAENHFDSYEQQFENAKENRIKALQENAGNLFKKNFFDSVKNIAIEWAGDSKDIQQKKENIDSMKRDIDKNTADRLMELIVKEYKNNIVDAHGRLMSTASAFWAGTAGAYREDLIKTITNNESLSEEQRNEIQKIIMEYQPLQFADDADQIFIKNKFLRGNLFGIRFGRTEKIDTAKLVSIYNNKIHSAVKSMSDMINANCYSSFVVWQNSLLDAVEKDITKFNPDLRRLTDIIKEETDAITKLQDDQQLICRTLDSIKEMMSWKDLN